MARVIIIGGGITGLVCAERLAAKGVSVLLLEAAPELGGRAGGFRDPLTGLWLDRGPHLVSGAYHAFLGWCRRIGAGEEIRWQTRLSLTFVHKNGKRTHLQPHRWPWPATLLAATARLWGAKAACALVRMRFAAPRDGETSAAWLARIGAPASLRAELLDPLHLAIMNAHPHQAPATSFRKALLDALGTAAHARLGWWRRPFAAGIAQLARAHLARLGVEIRTRARVQALDGTQGFVRLRGGETLSADLIVLAVSPRERARLFGLTPPATSPIANLFLWAKQAPPLAGTPFACALPSGRWWFDLTRLWHLPSHETRLFCAVQSASAQVDGDPEAELARLLGARPHITRTRLVIAHHATTLPTPSQPLQGARLVDASRPPAPDDIPCTLELAARRGEQAAQESLKHLELSTTPARARIA